MEQELNLIEGTARADFLIGSWKDDLILSGAGNDVVFARSGNDIVDAGDGNDAVFAGDGDDLVMTGLGRDYADGGRGIDTAKFDGDRSDYRVVSFFGIVFVTDLRNGETDTLRNFEFLEFDDGRYFPDGSPVQRPPEAVDDEAETSEDAPVSIDVLANDSDPNDDSLTVIEATADNGEVIIEADGTLTYTPDENFSGKDKISYTISDGNGGTSSATVAVQVGGVADEPTLAAQTSYETLDLAEIPLSDLVAKLVDQDGSERLTVKFNKLPEGAMISIPAAIAEKDLGIEELTARRSRLLEEVEERESEIAALNRQIDLLERDDPSSPDLPGLREQRDETIRQLTAKQDEKNEVEAELELATKERAELSKTAGPDGMIEFDDISSGFVLKLPPGTTEDFVLEVHAIATESDPVASEDVRTAVSKLEIEINVKESPSLKDDEAATREDTPVIIKVLENDSDSDGDDLSVVEFTDGANGRTFLNPDGTITYRPDPNTSGEDQFTYTVEDGNGGRSTATVKLLVGGVADRPLFEKYDTFVVRDLAEVPLDGFAARLQDRDGSEKLTLKFFGLPAGSVILNAPAIAEKEAAISELESRLILLRNEIDVLEQDLREVSARIEDLQQTNPDSEELPGLLEQKASLESQVQDKAEAKSKAEADLEQLVFEKSQLTKKAGEDGTIEFHDLEDGFVLRLPEGETENLIVRVQAIATESDPVLDEADRTAEERATINFELLESPDAQDDTAVTAEDTPITIPVTDNDTDSDGDPITVIDVIQPPNGSTAINPDNSITYTPNPNFSGDDEFSYTITDGNGGTSSATVKVKVGGVADTPSLLVPDQLNAIDLAPIPLDSIDASLVDIDGSERLKVKFGGLPAGAVIANPEKIAQKTEQIEALTARIDELDLRIAELNESIAATQQAISVLENDSNQGPINDRILNELRSLLESLQEGLAEATVENEEAKAERAEASAVLAELSKTTDADGHIAIDDFGDGYVLQLPKGTTKNFELTIDAIATESDPVASEDFRTATSSATIRVGVLETLAPQDDTATTIEDTSVTIFATDNDVGEQPQIIGVDVPANGTTSIDANGNITYTPDANFSGVDTFDYQVADQFGVTETATVQVTVGGVADTPNLSTPTSLSTTDLAPIRLDDIEVSLNDLDGSESLKVKFGGLPEGTIVSSPARIGGVTGLLEVAQSDIDRNEAQTAQFEADLAETLRAIEEINALPNPTQEQLDELAALEQTKSDLEGRLQGLIDQRTELVARRDEIAERLDKLSQEAGVDGHVVIEEFGSFFDLQLPDGTIDDFVLTVEAMATESDPVASEPQRAASASATIDVSVQEIPVAVDDELIVREDIPATINVTANDTDSDGDSLTIVGVTNGANGTAVDVGSGNVQYTPDPNFSGDDEFTYTIEDPDGNQSTATVRVTVFGVADVPGLTVPETLQTIDLADIDLSGIMGTLVDTDGSESLQIKLSDVPPGSAVTNPDAIATLEQERGENDATIKILSGNVKTNQGLISDKEGELLDLLNDPNATQEEIDAKRDEIDVLRQQISDDTEQLAAANARNAEIAAELSTLTLTPDTEGMVRIPGDTAGWVLRLSPDTTENFGLGVEALATESGEVLNEDDRTASSGQTVVGVRVFESSQAQNDNVGTDEDTPVTIAVLANDLGDLGAPVDVVDASNGANGTVEINSDGTITYTPNLDFNGNDQFTYTIEEEGAGQSTATVTVNVAPVNDLPQSGPVITGTPEVGQTLTANPDPIFDPDGIRSIDQYLWEGSSDGGNSWGPIVGPFQSTLEITPDLEGLIIRVRVFYTDEGGTEEDAASAPTAAVEAANQDPIANEDNITFPGGLAVAIDVLDNDSDPDGDPVQIVSVTPPSNGITAILTGQQRIGYNPDEGFVGIDTFTYEISDGNGGTAIGTVNVDVPEQTELPPGGGGGGGLPGGGGGLPGGGGTLPPPGGGGGGVIVFPPINIIASSTIPGALESGSGPQTLTGSENSDLFVFEKGNGGVIIDGFQQGTGTAGEIVDQIQLAGFGLTFADLDSNADGLVDNNDLGVLGRAGGPVGVSFGDGDVLSVNGVSFLTEDDLLFV